MRISSEPGMCKQELAVVRKDLCSNGYPSQFLKTQQLRSSVAYPEEVGEDDRPKRAAVPYAQGDLEFCINPRFLKAHCSFSTAEGCPGFDGVCLRTRPERQLDS
ncbi:hypothetical protein MTO96_031426 [Rhipicephalus appendiculatus]